MARFLVATLLVICVGYASAALRWSEPRRRDSCFCGRDGRGTETWERDCISTSCATPTETWDVDCECGPDLSPGEIAGIAVGSGVFLILVVILICWVCCCCGCCGMNSMMCCPGADENDGMMDCGCDGEGGCGCMGCGCYPPDADPYGSKVMRGPVIAQPPAQPRIVVANPGPQPLNFGTSVIQAQPQMTYVM